MRSTQRKLQATATINIALPLIKKDGAQASGLSIDTLSTKIIRPDGTALSGYTEATFSEPNNDGVYNVQFPLNAVVKAFTLEDQGNPYMLTLDGSGTDVEPTSIEIWIMSRLPYEIAKTGDQMNLIDAPNATAITAFVTAVWERVITGSWPNNSAARILRYLRDAGEYSGAIWVNTVTGVTGVEPYENGTASLPSKNLEDALTLCVLMGFTHINLSNGSYAILPSSVANLTFNGYGAYIELGEQDISNGRFKDMDIGGHSFGTGHPHFAHCRMLTCTIPPSIVHGESIIAETVSLLPGYHYWNDCFTESSDAKIDFMVIGEAVIAYITNFQGDIEIINMTANDELEIIGDGHIIINANCIGGVINIHGRFSYANNGYGVTVNDYTNQVSIVTAIEGSSVLAKEATVALVKNQTDKLPVDPASETSVSAVGVIVTSILNRIGAFTGTGINTILGFFQSLLKKDAEIPSDIGGSFDPVTDSVEAIAEKAANMDVAVSTRAAGISGALVVTITVYEQDTVAPIPDYRFNLWNSNETVLLQSCVVTDSMGQVVLNMDAGTYKLRGQKAGTIPVNVVETLTVDETHLTKTVYAQPFSTTQPPDAALQTIYGYVWQLDKSARPGVVVKAQISKQQAIESAILDKIQMEAIVDANGYFEIFVLKGSKIQVAAGNFFACNITVTTDNSKSLASYANPVPEA